MTLNTTPQQILNEAMVNWDGEITKKCYCHLERVSYQEFFEQGGSADIISLISGGGGKTLIRV